jgi:hypothetical protein
VFRSPYGIAAAIARPARRYRARGRHGRYARVRVKRGGLIDFAVPRTAASRFIAHEPLYRTDDGHYQYKYLPAFAPLMIPFTWVSKEVAEFTWFTLTVAHVPDEAGGRQRWCRAPRGVSGAVEVPGGRVNHGQEP